jgi:cellulose synthase/poly-beta-1,6-N-acetylglucosamine synthase-like glycosyltransferase
MKPSEIVHAIIIATYKEAREILEPTFQSILASNYNMDQVIVVLAYEGRAGERTEELANQLIVEYGPKFKHAFAVKHPDDIPEEVIGKGGNITFAGKRLQKYLEAQRIDPAKVVVTTLDADNHPHKNYLAALSYTFAACYDPLHASFQPVAIYNNNIWDAPAPMRVVATGSSFFNIVLSLRPHALRNFSAHAQPMSSLIQTNFWSTRTIVEDGHQFWRSYFAFDGNYRVYPLYVPVYQDAVLSDKYSKTLKAQFIQLRRWAWGASDVSYVVDKGFFHKNKISKWDLLTKAGRLLEGHITWAAGAMLVLFAGFVPALFQPQNIAANELPLIVSRVQTVALIGLITTVFFALKTLPPKPARYKRHRSLFMVLQWVYLPVTTIIYNSFSAIYSQTRLMFGKYIGEFDVTEKAVVTEDKQTVK